ncbi:MAG: hypothetical protein K1X39_05475 [Thermoflexales bacterium]|nr:hypothetical protein [Thermoflexales bacterium]
MGSLGFERAFALLKHRFPHLELPAAFADFLREQESNGHVLHRVASGERLDDFLRRQDTPSHLVERLLTPQGRLRLRLDYHALLGLQADALYAYLIDQLAPIYDLQQVALDSETVTGFNAHGSEHVSNVARKALSLARAYDPLGARETLAQEVVIGGLMHDLGNLIGRKLHGLYGVYLMALMFEQTEVDAATLDSFTTALEVTLFHEVEFGAEQGVFKRLDPATLSVIIADKTDVSFRRVSAKSNVSEAMRDAHVLVNLLVANASIARETTPGSGRFVWRVDFRSKFDLEHFDLFSSLLKATGRVRYPQEWQALYEESNIEYLFVFQSTFLTIYLSRLYLTLRAVFAMFPSVNEFVFTVDDAERSVSLTRVFTRNGFRQQVQTLGKLFFREQWAGSVLAQVIGREA